MIASTPSQATWFDADGGDRLDHRFVGADDGEEIAVADDLDRPLRGSAQGGLVERFDRRAASRLAHDARMRHAVERHVVDKDRLAEHLGGKVDARRVPADDAIVGGVLAGGAAGGGAHEIDSGGERPVIVAGRPRRDG